MSVLQVQHASPCCFGGHFTSAYEQNTQQSPGFGVSRTPQALQV